MEELIVEKSGWSLWASLSLRCVPLTLFPLHFLLSIRHLLLLLLLRWRHSHHDLFGAERFGCRTRVLHKSHQELSVAIWYLLRTTRRLTQSTLTLIDQFLKHLLRPGRRLADSSLSLSQKILKCLLGVTVSCSRWLLTL